MPSYDLQFVLSAYNLNSDVLKDTISGFGEGLEVVELGRDSVSCYCDFEVHISTRDPTLIFDSCSAIGRIKSVRIDEKKDGVI